MKFLALLLSLLTLTLTTVPCCPLEVNETDAHQCCSTEKQDTCTQKDDKCKQSCSPFYVCGTCIGFTIDQPTVFTFTLHLKHIQHNAVYILPELSQISIAIWQPPKLS